MTYFNELEAAVDRDPRVRSGDLVFQGTRVPVDTLLDYLAKGKDVETFVAGHPTVHAQDAHLVARAWEDIRRDADEEEAHGRLLAHADWALISQRVARRIDAQRERSPKRPDLGTLTTWVDAVARELGGGPTPTHRPREDRRPGPGGELPMGRARDVEVHRTRFTVRLTDGRQVSVPIEWFPRLEGAAPDERTNWSLIGDGEGIRWPDLDEDISVHSLLRPEETIPSREIRKRKPPRR